MTDDRLIIVGFQERMPVCSVCVHNCMSITEACSKGWTGLERLAIPLPIYCVDFHRVGPNKMQTELELM